MSDRPDRVPLTWDEWMEFCRLRRKVERLGAENRRLREALKRVRYVTAPYEQAHKIAVEALESSDG